MADGSGSGSGSGARWRPTSRRHYQPLRSGGFKAEHHTGPAPAREHSVMVVRACGREWVLKSWKPKG